MTPIEQAAQILAAAMAEQDRLPVLDAARRAWTPWGPSMDELVARITARRQQAAPAGADARPQATPDRDDPTG